MKLRIGVSSAVWPPEHIFGVQATVVSHKVGAAALDCVTLDMWLNLFGPLTSTHSHAAPSRREGAVGS